MSEDKEELLQYDNLRDFLEAMIMADDKYYEEEETRLTELAKENGITPLQMGYLEESIKMFDSEHLWEDSDRKPFVELIEDVAKEIGVDKTRNIVHNWLTKRTEGWPNVQTAIPEFSDKTTIIQALQSVRSVTQVLHEVGVNKAMGFLSGYFGEVRTSNTDKGKVN